MFKLDLIDQERVLNIYRQTEAVLFKPVFIIFIAIYLPWYFLLKYELANKYSKLVLFWTILIVIYGVYKYLIWLLNVYIITDKRIISVNYQSLWNKKVLESPYENILHISFETNGLWSTLTKNGNVLIQIKGLVEPIIFKNVANASKIKDLLWEKHLNLFK